MLDHHKQIVLNFIQDIRLDQYQSIHTVCGNDFGRAFKQSVKEIQDNGLEFGSFFFLLDDIATSYQAYFPHILSKIDRRAQANIAGCWLISILDRGADRSFPCGYLPLALAERGIEFLRKQTPNDLWDDLLHELSEFSTEIRKYDDQIACQLGYLADVYHGNSPHTDPQLCGLESKERSRWSIVFHS